MQVKDYLQVLSDDNKIRVEKIGSGNWYWSFPSDEKKAKDNDLSKAWEENAKASAMVNELQAKSDEAEAARADEQDTLSEFGKKVAQFNYIDTDAFRERPQNSHGQAQRAE